MPRGLEISVVLALIAGCTSTPTGDQPSAPPATDKDKQPTTMPVQPDELAIAQMESAMKRGRTFRHLSIGSMGEVHGILTTSRITWVLETRGEGARLSIFCERFKRGPGRALVTPFAACEMSPFLVGEENRRDLWWAAPSVGVYDAPKGTDDAASPSAGIVLTLRETIDSQAAYDLADGPGCGEMPSTLTLDCAEGVQRIRPLGARLSYAMIGEENQRSGEWIPPSTEDLSVLRCGVRELASSGPTPIRSGTFLQNLWRIAVEHPLVFVDAPKHAAGVEHVFADHDATLQTGDYRWLQPE